jgi:thioredoxin reductase (NADPH)
MAKPIILAVDDEPGVLRGVEGDLRRRYRDRYRILSAESGAAALEALTETALRGNTVALLLADQRMPGMSGVEFLKQAIQQFPDAKRALLTAYADTEAAIQAINEIGIDHYLLKPWDPPEERFYPVIDDLLDQWLASYHPEFEGIRVLGHRWSPPSHAIKDFLARNQIPYQWIDLDAAETDPEARKFADIVGRENACLPLVIFPDGEQLSEPTIPELAERVGLKTHAEMPFYDLVIVGGGPAGLAAAVYGASEGLSTLMIEREAPGGQAGTSSRIENYLGFPVGLSGADLARRAVAQARRFGVEILSQEVTTLCVKDQYRNVKFADGSEVSGHVTLIATGVSYRKLDVPGIDKLTGAGVYYGAAMTEAVSCKDDDVFIVGGANSAGQAAIYFAKYARLVTILVRGTSLTKSMSQYLIDEIERTPNIVVRTETEIVEAFGDTKLTQLSIKDNASGTTACVPATAVFIFIGAMPRTDWLDGVLERDDHGFLMAGPDLMREGKRPKGWTPDRDPFLLETNVPGVFVAGDVRSGSVKRVASGVGEGSIAVQFIHRYLANVR